MSFGLMNAPATFQALMNETFRGLLRRYVLVFFDDILVYSQTWEEHLLHLERVLSILANEQLYANKKKCNFGRTKIEYLGHVISAQGVAVDPSKVDSVTSWPVPTNIRGVRGFLGLTGYYRKFVKGYRKIAQPLTELTKKDNFRWTEEAHRAFDTLKICLTHTPVLALPRFDEEFRLECDASGSGIRAILVQNNRPVAYFSKSLSGKNLMKSTYEKELMAVVLAVQHWRPYLLGRHFVVQTGHKSLKQLLQQKVINGNQQDWLAKLLGYNFDIVYKSGKENRGADSLSRRDDDGEINILVYFPFWAYCQAIAAETQEDARLKKIVAELQEDPASHPSYSYSQNTLFYGNRLVVAETSGWIPQLLQEFHASPQGGHSGFYKTYRRLAENLYWKGMKGTVQRFVRSCDVCQRQKYLTSSPARLLQPLPVPERIWDDLSLDFITGLPKSQGFETIMVVVGRLSKYVHFVPLKHPFTARSVAELFVKEIVRLHGVPNSLVSDRDPLFMSQFWQEFFKLQGTKLQMSTAYHPQSDGQTEVVNRCLETYLRCFIADQPKVWVRWLSWAEYWFNTNFHEASQATPFEIVYGRKPPTLIRRGIAEVRVEAVQREITERDEALKQLQTHLARAQERMKLLADNKRTERNFDVGDCVFLKLRPHRQHLVVSRINPKLAARYYGP